MQIKNTSWATNFTVRESYCSTPLWDHYCYFFTPLLGLESLGKSFILVYVPGPDYALATERIVSSYNEMQRNSYHVILTAVISTHLPNLQQYVTCPTRMNKSLDQLYGNVEGAYVPTCCPPLRLSDHNLTHLLLQYLQKLRREKPLVKHI